MRKRKSISNRACKIEPSNFILQVGPQQIGAQIEAQLQRACNSNPYSRGTHLSVRPPISHARPRSSAAVVCPLVVVARPPRNRPAPDRLARPSCCCASPFLFLRMHHSPSRIFLGLHIRISIFLSISLPPPSIPLSWLHARARRAAWARPPRLHGRAQVALGTGLRGSILELARAAWARPRLHGRVEVLSLARRPAAWRERG